MDAMSPAAPAAVGAEDTEVDMLGDEKEDEDGAVTSASPQGAATRSPAAAAASPGASPEAANGHANGGGGGTPLPDLFSSEEVPASFPSNSVFFNKRP